VTVLGEAAATSFGSNPDLLRVSESTRKVLIGLLRSTLLSQSICNTGPFGTAS
jgi:hypothetical protein